MATLEALETKIADERNGYTSLVQDQNNAISALQALKAQLNENQMVQKEFKILAKQHAAAASSGEPEPAVYKLIGPVLVKQDRAEAVINVDKRIEFIRAEIDKAENKIKQCQDKVEKKRTEIGALMQKAEKLKSPA
ncbi:Prefoldin [Ramicandelaber brevisporus]|nr:Prefoldin [Ramicandelaber brevisporus]